MRASPRGVDDADVGGARLAYPADTLWGDAGCVADVQRAGFLDFAVIRDNLLSVATVTGPT